MRCVLVRTVSILLSLLALAGVSCGRRDSPSSEPRLVLLFAPCTVNADYLSPYDPSVPYTPNLQRFADEGLIFERHITEAGQSGIAYASIISGAQADHHQIYRHPLVMRDDVHVISEAYAARGYETFIWNKQAQASPQLGYAQGIPAENQRKGRIDLKGELFEQILERLATDPGYRAFVFTNFTVSHAPYKPRALRAFIVTYPDQARGLTQKQIRGVAARHKRDHIGLSYNHAQTIEKSALAPNEIDALHTGLAVLYASNLFKLDLIFGSVLDAIREAGLMDESLIVFTADHGEVVDRANALYPWSHAMQLAPEVLRVPLIIRAPQLGVETGRYEGVTRSIDILPTMAGLSSIDLSDVPGMAGVDLSSAIRGESSAPDQLAYSHTSILVRGVHSGMQNPWVTKSWSALARNVPDQDVHRIWTRIQQGDRVYKRRRFGDGEWQLSAFDLDSDPEERVDTFDPEDAHDREIAQALSDYYDALVASYQGEEGAKSLLPEEEEEALRSLGYIE